MRRIATWVSGALIVALSPALAAWSQQTEPAAEEPAAVAEEPAPASAAAPLKLKIFKLKHRTPGEIKQLLALWPPAPTEEGTPPAPVLEAVDARQGLIFVRSTEEQLARLDAAIKKLDVTDEELAKIQIEGLYLHTLAHLPIEGAQATLRQLGLKLKTLTVAKVVFLVLPDDEQERQDVLAVLEAIDVPQPEAEADETETAAAGGE
jgi:hypothetical protein